MVLKKLLIIPLILSVIGLIFLANFVKGLAQESSAVPMRGNYLSPIPEKLTSLVRGITQKNPDITIAPFPSNEPLTKEDPKTTAESAVSVDITDNKLIFEKNAYQRRPVASTIKIMTAILALENSDLDQKITISNSAAGIGEDVMISTAGERYTLRDLLHGLIMLSANDAAEAIAESTFSRRELFIAMMNSKASELGLKNTKFVNPTGLDGDGEHYSTAADLVQIARYAMKIPYFKELAKTREYQIDITPEHKGQYIYNQTNLLGSYPGVEGIKTGYTPDAGLCLVTYAQNGGHEIISVVLGSSDRRGDMKKILDLSFKTIGVEIPKHD